MFVVAGYTKKLPDNSQYAVFFDMLFSRFWGTRLSLPGEPVDHAQSAFDMDQSHIANRKTLQAMVPQTALPTVPSNRP
jgi:hypothetical protein